MSRIVENLYGKYGVRLTEDVDAYTVLDEIHKDVFSTLKTIKELKNKILEFDMAYDGVDGEKAEEMYGYLEDAEFSVAKCGSVLIKGHIIG